MSDAGSKATVDFEKMPALDAKVRELLTGLRMTCGAKSSAR